ncbi:hypothetical protein D3C87_1833930 [compost metagenome]
MVVKMAGIVRLDENRGSPGRDVQTVGLPLTFGFFTLGTLELYSIRRTGNQGNVLLFREYSGCSCSVSIRSVFNQVSPSGGNFLALKLEGNI